MGEGQDIGHRVKELRETRGWSLGQLAAYSKVSTAYISRLEAGLVPRPSAMMLNRLAGALGVSLTYLLTGERPEERPLPEFHAYVSRKFRDNPAAMREALIKVYEAWQSVLQEEAERQRKAEERAADAERRAIEAEERLRKAQREGKIDKRE